MDIHASRKNRNHEIEFWRFFFAVVVFLFHMNVLPYGALGVDFFFLLTGILMMASIQKAIKETKAPRSTLDFVLHKVKAFYPELLLATVFTISVALIVCFISNTIDTTFLIKAVKTFFNGVAPIKMTGIMGSPGDYNGATWYLSSMIIGIIITYPLLVRFGNHPLLFITGVFTCGYLCTVHGQLGYVYTHLGITYEGNLRAIGELLLGATCYQAINAFQKLNLTYLGSLLTTIVKYGCILAIIAISMQNHTKWHGVALLLALLALILIFSRHGIDTRLFQNKLCLFLGALSLPLYITHRITTTSLYDLISIRYSPPLWASTCICFGLSLSASLLIMLFAASLRKNSSKIANLFIKKSDRTS